MRSFPDDFCSELADYLEDRNNELAQNFTVVPDGPIDPEVAEEVEQVDGWIKVLRQSDTSSGEQT
jgi:hypothetical protein